MSKLLDDILFRRYRQGIESLHIYRVIFATFALLFVVPRNQWLRDIPDSFYYPVLGPPLFFDGFPPSWIFTVLDILLVLALVALALGWRIRTSFVAVGSLLLVGNMWRYSLGKIDHEILLVSVPLMLAFLPWNTSPSDSPAPKAVPSADHSERPKADSWPLALLALVIALAMFSAGLLKLLGGWADPDTFATLHHLERNAAVESRTPLLWDAVEAAANIGWPWKLVDYGTLLLEIALLLAWPWRKTFKIACAVATLFHVGVYATMDIGFSANLIAYLVFFDLSYIKSKMPHFLASSQRITMGEAMIGGFSAVLIVLILADAVPDALGEVRSTLTPAIFTGAAVAAFAYLIWSGIEAASR